MILKQFGLLLILWLATGFPEEGQTKELTPLEQQGKAIYRQGTSPLGNPITVYLEAAKIDVSANSFPCVRCHGHDGRGKTEGGITSSDIRWEVLSKPYGVVLPSGRRHSGYDETKLKRAITMGMDPQNNPLQTVMPRYRFMQDDLQALVAYLKKLGNEQEPGISDTHIQVGTLLFPEHPTYQTINQAAKKALVSFFDDVNQKGGFYNRQIDLHIDHLPPSLEQWPAKLEAFIEEKSIFALISTFMGGAETELSKLLREKKIPLIGGLTISPDLTFPPNPYVFYLSPGIPTQMVHLIQFEMKRKANSMVRIGTLFPDEMSLQRFQPYLSKACQQLGCQSVDSYLIPQTVSDIGDLGQTLKNNQTTTLLLLGVRQPELALLAELNRHAWEPTLLVPGALATQGIFQIPRSFDEKLFLSFPEAMVKSPKNPSIEFQNLANRYQLASQHRDIQLSVLTSASLLSEGIKRAGKELSRENLISQLDKLFRFETGFSEKITFTPNRRIGAETVVIAQVSLATQQLIPITE